MSKFKVAWREVANTLIPAVIGPKDNGKLVIPDHTLVAVSFENEKEAHYFCALLGSSTSRLIVQSYITGHPSPHILDNIAIPQYQEENSLHKKLSSLSIKAHNLAEKDEKEALKSTEKLINQASADLWDISNKELEDINSSLEELE